MRLITDTQYLQTGNTFSKSCLHPIDEPNTGHGFSFERRSWPWKGPGCCSFSVILLFEEWGWPQMDCLRKWIRWPQDHKNLSHWWYGYFRWGPPIVCLTSLGEKSMGPLTAPCSFLALDFCLPLLDSFILLFNGGGLAWDRVYPICVPCQQNILWHDGHTLCMDGMQVVSSKNEWSTPLKLPAGCWELRLELIIGITQFFPSSLMSCWKGNQCIRRLVLFWYPQISLKVGTPGLYLWFLEPWVVAILPNGW